MCCALPTRFCWANPRQRQREILQGFDVRVKAFAKNFFAHSVFDSVRFYRLHLNAFADFRFHRAIEELLCKTSSSDGPTNIIASRLSAQGVSPKKYGRFSAWSLVDIRFIRDAVFAAFGQRARGGFYIRQGFAQMFFGLRFPQIAWL